MKIQLELLEREAAGFSDLASRIAAARELSDTSLAEVRQLSHILRPQMLDELGLEPTLRWLARTFQKRTGIDVEVVLEGRERRADADLETLVYRIVQEALTNVARHSGARAVTVTLCRERRKLSVRIADRGTGFDADALQPASDRLGLRVQPAVGERAAEEQVRGLVGVAARRDVKRSAKISFARKSLTCMVRNVSATGAAIEAANLADIPDSFKLVLEMETAARHCAVVWRRKTQIGVEFR